MRPLDQKTQRKFYSVQEKSSWEKDYELSSDKRMKGKNSFNSSAISQRSSDEGQKKILFLKFKYPKELSEFIGSGDESNQTEERLPEKLRIELEIYIEKSLKGGFFPPRKKYLLTRIFQLCAGLTLQRN